MAKSEATSTKFVAKECEAVEASEVEVLGEDEDEVEGDAGEEGALPVTTLIFSFIP